MPVSRRRDKHIETPTTPASRVPVNLDSPRWLAPLMVTLLIVGLLYIVVFYVAGREIPFMVSIGNLGNVGIGFGLMSAGFILSTRWR